MKFFIKYMVSERCIMKAGEEPDKPGIPQETVQMGYLELPFDLTEEQQKFLEAAFEHCKLTLLRDRKQTLSEQIKNVIICMIQHAEETPKVKSSVYILRHFSATYNYLSNVFLKETGITIRRFIIGCKIERVKEWLVYDKYTLAEIADKLWYNDAAHLSKVFKNTTGMTPTEYKQAEQKKRRKPENL